MHLHLTNCHGEWLAIAALVANLPFAALWVRTTFSHYFGDCHAQRH
jgi:hypothetical protein